MKKHTIVRGALVAAALMGGIMAANVLISLGAPSGAVFTTDAAGTQVNQNIYASKGDVFLSGGPANSQCPAAGLSDGEYVFQVTDPQGKTLLSTDDIVQRRFSVKKGVIDAYLGSTHANNAGPCSGRIIGLAPFNTTPNKGGEYKLWVAPASSYAASQGVFGFKPNDSKHDNFKVKSSAEQGGGTVLGRAYNDQSRNGTDDSEPGLGGLTLTLSSGGTVAKTVTTDAGGYYTLTAVVAGTYELCATKPQDGQYWFQTQPAGATGCTTVTVGQDATVVQNFGFGLGVLE